MQLDYEPLGEVNYEIAKPFEAGRAALVTDRISGNYIGVIGEFTAGVRKRLKLPVYAAGFEIMTKPLLEAPGVEHYQPLAKFPGTTQDISFKTPLETTFVNLSTAIEQTAQTTANEHGYILTITPLDIYHKEKAKLKHITFRLQVHHPDRSVTTDEITKFVDQVAEAVTKSTGAERI